MKIVRKIVEIDEELCDGCGQCVTGCAEGALDIIDGKAKVISDNLCDGLGACIGECPTGALEIIEREAEAFDEAAVEKHLEHLAGADDRPVMPFPTGGCPSADLKMFAPRKDGETAPPTGVDAGPVADSALTHWPIKIRLVPPHAPFLKQAHLLVLADCGAVAFPNLHRDYLEGRVVLIGCPKFDEVPEYIERFAQIFAQADIRSVTAVRMEVPCCAGLLVIVQKAMEKAGVDIPLEEVVVLARGQRVKA
jgi:NAD-dependent dihydropyrimidine dehydrogenase PreA subunit